MSRAGTKKRPFYHLVVADSRFPRDGRFIERLGFFNPLLPKDNAERLKLDLEKVKAWMAKGACRPTASCVSLTPPASPSARSATIRKRRSRARNARRRPKQAVKTAEAAEAAAKTAKAAKAEAAKAEAAKAEEAAAS